MELLERQAALEQLGRERERAASDGGRTVLVAGEAGIGKTRLIETFLAGLPADTPCYRGGCEALFAARPLGPLFDIAAQCDGELADLLRSGADNRAIHSAFLTLVEQPALAGAVFVFEDIHWADNATMDFLKFIGRRVARGKCLLVTSYRDDEVGASHALHHVLGDLPADSTSRMVLESLSVDAIATLGRFDRRKARAIADVTGGNPFFVRELLSAGDAGIPSTVTDAILARAARLSPGGRALLNLVSVVPGRCEIRYIETAFREAHDLLDECAERGLLTVDRKWAAFHHELARLAVEDALPAGQRRKWNAHMLDVLRGDQPEALARLAHHADMSGNADTVLRYAPPAADQAARLGAHREAVKLYRQALDNAGTLADRERAELLEYLAYELYVTGRIGDAVAARQRSLQLWLSLGEDTQVARSYRWLSRLEWFNGNRNLAERYAEQALEAGETRPGSKEYGMACSNRAQLFMLTDAVSDATEWSNRAIGIAETNDDADTLAHALNNLGAALGMRSPERGMPHLVRSLEISLEHDYQEHVARAYTNIACILVSNKRFVEAAGYLESGIDYSAERDLDSWLYYMQGWRARLRFETGDWDGAAEDALAVIRGNQNTTLISSPALTALARLRLRRGDPEAMATLEQALKAITETGELQRFAPLEATRAERAWLLGEQSGATESLAATRDWAARLDQPWIVGELDWWARKLGARYDTECKLPEPYELLLRRGDWAGAANAWKELGCPYESALALAEGDEDARREALRIFERLGAAPAAALLRRELRAMGVRDLPTEARQSTKGNPAGLTNRQLDVLRALCDGLSDAEIASRLFISPRTANHHVSAILGKLGAQSRTEAAALALKLGIGEENRHTPEEK